MAIVKDVGEKRLSSHGFVFLAQLNGKVALIAGSYNDQANLLNEAYNPDWQIFFHSLAFNRFTADSVSPLASDILGSWVNVGSTNAISYTFAANGRYAFGSAFRASGYISYGSILKKTTTWTGDGKYILEGNKLTMIKDNSEIVQSQSILSKTIW